MILHIENAARDTMNSMYEIVYMIGINNVNPVLTKSYHIYYMHNENNNI